MKKTSILALALIAPFSVLTQAHAGEKAPAGIKADTKRDLAKLFDGKLTDADGKSVSSTPITKAKYTLVYFSAHWCPPCRKFTPELVKFVNENRKDGNLEVVFVSSDESKAKMTAYMKEAKMPWGGMMGKGASLGDIEAGVSSIPRVRVFDTEGKLIMESKEIGRPQLLAALKEKLK